MAMKSLWALKAALPLALLTACTSVSVDDGSGDQVRVTVQAKYEKRPLSSGSLLTLPARYALGELRYASNDQVAGGPVGLAADGTGTINVPRGSNVYAVIYADVMAPASSTNLSFALYGSVKKGVPAASYTSVDAFDAVPTWYTTSEAFAANSDGTIPVTARESTSEAGAFAIADQMVAFARGVGNLEPSLPLPDLHVFWDAGTGSSYPTAVTTSRGDLLIRSTTRRPILSQQLWYGGPSNCADAFNDSLLQENFAHALFAFGSYWQVNSSNQYSFGTIIRSDNDPVAVSPWIASESSLAFQNGFGNFLSSAFRNDPYQYLVAANGSVSSWRLDQHTSPAAAGGGEFYGASVARSLWGTWKNAFSGSSNGLQTMWNATVPTPAAQPFEYGNAPLGCYPTYLMGLKRLGSSVSAAIDTELNLENIGNGLVPTSPTYFSSEALWKTITPSSSAIPGSLVTYDNNASGYADAYYDRVESQAYRFHHAGGNLTVTLTTSAPGLIVELFDHVGLVASNQATSSQGGTIALTNLAADDCTVRVRLDPAYKFNGNPASYSLVIQ
jgi:hypothetical protein